MEKSQHYIQSKTKYIWDMIAALLMGLGSFMVLKTTFGLKGWFGGSITGGLIKCWNDMAEALGRSDFYLMDKLAGASDNGGTFLLIMLVIFIALSYLIARSRNLWLLLIYILPLVILTLGTGLMVKPVWVMVLLSGMLLMALQKKFDGNAGLWNAVFVGAVLAIAIILTLLPFIKAGLDEPTLTRHTSAAISNAVEDMRYGGKDTGVALTITMDAPESYYLRGFVGDKFVGSQWTGLSNSTYYDSTELLHWLGEKGFTPYTQLAEVDGLVSEAQGSAQEEANHISIDVKNASREYIYMPYEMTGQLPEGAKDWGGSHLTATGMRGMGAYEYDAQPNITGRWTDLIALFTVPVNDEMISYSQQESHSNVDIYKKYTYLSDEEIEALISEIGSRGNQEKGHVSYKVAIEKVRAYMDDKILYTEKQLERGDMSFIGAFFEYHKGNDVDYATAATLMFRYYGIPARYVEGYLVTLEDKEAMEAGQAYDIPAENWHAWTEIYVDTIGWVPVEVCEPYYGVMAEPDLEKGLENENTINDFDQLENNDGGEGSHHESEPQSRNGGLGPLAIIGIGLGIIVLLVLLFFAARALRSYVKRQRSFKNADVRAAVCAIFGYARKKGIILSEEAEAKGLEAAYSTHEIVEEDRALMLMALKEGKKPEKKRGKKNEK